MNYINMSPEELDKKIDALGKKFEGANTRITAIDYLLKMHRHLGSDLTKILETESSVAGDDTQIQFNDDGVLAGDADFTWDKTTGTLTLGVTPTITTLTDGEAFIIRTKSVTTGTSGLLSILSGNGDSVGGILIEAGTANGGDVGGTVTVKAGNGDAGGGELQLLGGNGTGTNQNGGDVDITGGSPIGTGVEGNIAIRGGTALATSAVGGHLIIPKCPGTPTGAAPAGALVLDTTNNIVYIRSGGNWVALN